MRQQSNNPKILVIGSANMDLITYFTEFPQKGETVFAERFEVGFGGKGANQAVAAAKLGVDVSIVAKVGTDFFGSETIKHFKDMGVSTKYITKVDNAATGVATIVVDTEGNNWILVAKGANNFITREDVDAARADIESSNFLLMQLEIPMTAVYYGIKLARAVGTRVILNLSPVPTTGLKTKSLRGVFVLILNKVELISIAGGSSQNVDAIEREARKIVDMGIDNVIVTLGEEGSLLVNEVGTRYIPTLKVHPVDTTGAGDAFAGSFTAFLSKGKSLIESIKLANYYAAFSVQHRGTQKSFCSETEFTRRLGSIHT